MDGKLKEFINSKTQEILNHHSERNNSDADQIQYNSNRSVKIIIFKYF